MTQPLRVLHVTPGTGTGGADAVARRLAGGLRERGHDAWLAVGRGLTRDPHVVKIPHGKAAWLDQLAMRWPGTGAGLAGRLLRIDRKSTRLNSSHT